MNRVATVTVLLLVFASAAAPASGAVLSAGHGDGPTGSLAVDPAASDGPVGETPGSTGDGSLAITNVSTSVETPVVGQRQQFTVTIENDGSAPVEVTNVSIIPKENYVYQGAFTERTDFRVLEPGETLTVDLWHRFEESGIRNLQAFVQGQERDPDADTNRSIDVRRDFTMEVIELSDPVVEVAAASGSMQSQLENTVRVTVTNDGQTPIESVQVQFGGELTVVDNPLQREARIPAGESRTFLYNVTADEPGERAATVSIRYDHVDDRTRTMRQRRTFRFEEPRAAELRISRITFDRDGESLTIEGDIANVGGADARGVTIEPFEGEGVVAVPPKERDVAGSVPQDELRSFRLTLEVDEGIEELRLSVSYSTNGIQETTERRIGPIPELRTTTTVSEESIGLPALLVGGVLVVVVLGFVGVAWYNAGSGDDPGSGGEAPVSPDDGGTDADAIVEAPGNGPAGGGPPSAGSRGARATRNGQAPQGGGDPGGDGHARGQPRGGHAQGGTGSGPTHPQGGAESDPAHARDRGRHAPGQGGGGRGQDGSAPGQGRAGPASGREPQTEHGEGGAHGGEVRCDGCGDTYARDQVGSIAIGEGDTARTCQTCQKRALTAAKQHLGAKRDRELGEGVDELVEAMADEPTCDGCGDARPESEMEAMTLPDGSSALACPSCREEALEAARGELTGKGK